MVLNPQTNRYDYKGSITKGFLETFNLLKVDESGNKVGFTIDFGEVTGSFNCSKFGLTSLKGAPKKVGWDFYSSHNQLTSLKGAPQEVYGDFYCIDNQLTSLEGAPKEVGGSFYCSDNPDLYSLDGIGEVGGRIYKSFKISDI